uniref:CRISPR type III-B/RAMP module-associated protein Cmr5 n=1 Tax=uncultured Thiotrichaceae bacterium TaxID=298394 RepID=A0A6S6UN19_9GAMM|nr:MAG: Type III-B CRISPR module-associated protein Cmr5 [uncultured Thiotrichaceae bacterium]
MQTMQQKRARYAMVEVLKLDDQSIPQKVKDEYKSYANALPAMIHMNGLGQAAAFYKAKGSVKQDKIKKGEFDKGFAYRKLYELLSGWLIQADQPYRKPENHEGSWDLMKGITQNNMHDYRLAQAEAQALMDWVKKFASAYLVESAGSGEKTVTEEE